MGNSILSRSSSELAFRIFVVSAAILLYLPALSGQFIWDDAVYVTESQLVHAADGLYRMWFTTEAVDYWPVTNSLYWLQWHLWGAQTLGYHLVNVILHAADVLLFVAVLRRLEIPGARIAGLLFLVHPVNVESVAWIAELKNPLSMFFMLLATLGFVARPRFYPLSIFLFLLAMLSKGSVAVLPGILLVIGFWQRGRITKRDLARLLPFCVVAVSFTIVNVWFQTRHLAGSIRSATLVERILGAGAVVWFYLYQALLPIRLMFVYPHWNISADTIWWWIPLLAAILLTALLWRERRESHLRALLVAWVTFCLALVPVMGLTDVYYMRYSLVADHYLYVALLPVVACLGAGVSWLADARRDVTAVAIRVTACAVIAVLGVAAWNQSHLYADATTLWTAASRANPSCWLCESNVVVPLVARGTPSDLHEAETHLRAAIRMNPNAPESHDGLGVTLQKMGRFEEAVAEHERALVLNPYYGPARANLVTAREHLAVQLSKAERYQDAATIFGQVLRDDPNRAATHREIGYALLRLGRVDQSLSHLNQSVRLDPASPETHDTLATLWRTVGRRADAIAEYRKAVALAPNTADWHNNLGSALLDDDQVDAADGEFREALRCNPSSAVAHRNLGVALAARNRFEEAAAHLREAVRLDPDFTDAKQNLAEVTALIGKKSAR